MKQEKTKQSCTLVFEQSLAKQVLVEWRSYWSLQPLSLTCQSSVVLHPIKRMGKLSGLDLAEQIEGKSKRTELPSIIVEKGLTHPHLDKMGQ